MFTDDENPALAQLAEYAEARRQFWQNPPRGACGQPGGCALGDTVVILHTADDGIQRCATHHGRLRPRKIEYPCDNCGSGPAFRDPMHRRDEYLCADCHRKHDSYEPSERAMITKTQVRVGVTHSKGLKPLCVARGVTECKGQVKPRGALKGAVVCDRHADPRRFDTARQQ